MQTTQMPSARPLGRFPVLATRNLEEAREAVERIYLPHELTRSEGGDDLGMVLNAIEDKNFTLGYLTYGAPTQLSMPATENCYHVNLTTAGQTRADRQDGSRAKTAGRASGVVLLPDQLNRVRWTADAEQLILKIPRTALEGHLTDLLSRPIRSVIDFDFQFDLGGPRGQAFLASVEFLTSELGRPGGLAEMPLAREQLESFVMSQLLTAVRHPYTDELTAPAEPVRLGRLKPVVEYMECNADMPLSPVELARVGCMSVRTLHASPADLRRVAHGLPEAGCDSTTCGSSSPVAALPTSRSPRSRCDGASSTPVGPPSSTRNATENCHRRPCDVVAHS